MDTIQEPDIIPGRWGKAFIYKGLGDKCAWQDGAILPGQLVKYFFPTKSGLGGMEIFHDDCSEEAGAYDR